MLSLKSIIEILNGKLLFLLLETLYDLWYVIYTKIFQRRIMNMKKICLALVVVLSCVILASCNSKKLEDAVDVKTLEKQLINQLESMNMMQYYEDIDFQIKDNDIIYSYYYKSPYDNDVDALKSNLKNNESMLSGAAKSDKNSFEKEYDIRPDSISFRYYASDGSLIYEYKE